jgi:membrane-associated protease RseP (regulator of RpoE activity)
MSDNEIIEYFRKPTENTCGRFSSKQLKTYQLPERTFLPSIKLPFSAASLVALLLSFSSFGQDLKKIDLHVEKLSVPEYLPNGIGLIGVLGGVVTGQPVTDGLSGTVYAEDGIPLPGAWVVLNGTMEAKMTDASGQFEFDLDDARSEMILTISFIGYDTQYVRADRGPNVMLNVRMQPSMTGGIKIQYWRPRNIWWSVKTLFQ